MLGSMCSGLGDEGSGFNFFKGLRFEGCHPNNNDMENYMEDGGYYMRTYTGDYPSPRLLVNYEKLGTS